MSETADVFMTLMLAPNDAADLGAQADLISATDSARPYLTRHQLFKMLEPSSVGRAEVIDWLANRQIKPTAVQPGHPLAVFLRATRDGFEQAFGPRARRWLENPRSDRSRRIDWQLAPRIAGYVQGVQVLRDAEKSRHWLDGNLFLAAAAAERHGLTEENDFWRMPANLPGFSPDDRVWA